MLKTRGIIFRAKKYSETSLIVDIYTEEKGLLSYIISGVRSKKSRVAPALLQVMALVEIVAYDRPDKLNRIKEIRAAHVYQKLPFDLVRGSVGMFMAEVARKTIREAEENKELFQFLFACFERLDTCDTPFANMHLYFMLQLSAYLGFMPGGEACDETPFFDLQEGYFVENPSTHTYTLDRAQSLLWHQLLDSTLEEVHQVAMSRSQRQALLQHLIDFFGLHLDHFPQIHTNQILEDLFS